MSKSDAVHPTIKLTTLSIYLVTFSFIMLPDRGSPRKWWKRAKSEYIWSTEHLNSDCWGFFVCLFVSFLYVCLFCFVFWEHWGKSTLMLYFWVLQEIIWKKKIWLTDPTFQKFHLWATQQISFFFFFLFGLIIYCCLCSKWVQTGCWYACHEPSQQMCYTNKQITMKSKQCTRCNSCYTIASCFFIIAI